VGELLGYLDDDVDAGLVTVATDKVGWKRDGLDGACSLVDPVDILDDRLGDDSYMGIVVMEPGLTLD
jgi:hypothetical protein